MNQFTSWFITFIETIFNHLLSGIKSLIQGLYNLFIGYPINYVNSFKEASQSFNTTEWIISILAIFIIIFIYLGIIYLIIILAKRYLRFLKNNYEKEELIEEITTLKNQVDILLDEQDAITNLTIDPKLNSQSNERFTKLMVIDALYNETPYNNQNNETISLNDLVTRFINFAASQLNLYYTRKTVALFLAGMASSQTIILEGISGTGKTSLPYAMGKFFQKDASIISVQPSWRDRTEMLGFLNQFTKKYIETDFLASVYEATYRNDINIIVLDEMNLARVEYYFADFLSLLEMPDKNEWLLGLVPSKNINDPKNLIEGKLKISDNIWFVGTANRDDSTYQITDKVYDRVASIEINEKAVVVNSSYTEGIHLDKDDLNNLFNQAVINHKLSQSLLDRLDTLDKFIVDKFQIAFGNRILKQINKFIPVYAGCGMDQIDGLDYLIGRKIIRKFESLNLAFLKDELNECLELLDDLFGHNEFLYSKKLINDYLKRA